MVSLPANSPLTGSEWSPKSSFERTMCLERDASLSRSSFAQPRRISGASLLPESSSPSHAALVGRSCPSFGRPRSPPTPISTRSTSLGQSLFRLSHHSATDEHLSCSFWVPDLQVSLLRTIFLSPPVLPRPSSDLRVLDLFAGGGGWSARFTDQGRTAHLVGAVEMDSVAADSLQSALSLAPLALSRITTDLAFLFGQSQSS